MTIEKLQLVASNIDLELTYEEVLADLLYPAGSGR